MLKNLDIKTVKMGILFTCCAIILYNFLEINMDIWNLDDMNSKNDTDSENDDNYVRNSDDTLRRARQTKRDWILYQHFSLSGTSCDFMDQQTLTASEEVPKFQNSNTFDLF